MSEQRQPLPPEIEWTDGDGVKHTVGIESARKTLARFYEEWPGGWSEFEAERKRQQPFQQITDRLVAENEAQAALLRQAVEHLDAFNFWEHTELVTAIHQHLEGK